MRILLPTFQRAFFVNWRQECLPSSDDLIRGRVCGQRRAKHRSHVGGGGRYCPAERRRGGDTYKVLSTVVRGQSVNIYQMCAFPGPMELEDKVNRGRERSLPRSQASPSCGDF